MAYKGYKDKEKRKAYRRKYMRVYMARRRADYKRLIEETKKLREENARLVKVLNPDNPETVFFSLMVNKRLIQR